MHESSKTIYFHELDKYPYEPISPIWMLLCGLSSFFFFSYINRSFTLPKKKNKSDWPQQNTFVSFIHSSISSVLVIIGIIRSPEVLDDIFSHANYFNYLTIAFSLGYFVWDFIDCIRNLSASVIGVLVHHIAAFILFGYILFRTRNVGLAIYGLSLEINSVFLHARRLLRWYKPASFSYEFNEKLRYFITFANYLTFLIFRFGVVGIAYYKFHIEKHKASFEIYLLTNLITLTVYYLNGVLFYRLIKNDLILSTTSKRRKEKNDEKDSPIDEMLSTT